MNENVFTFLVIPAIVIATNIVVKYIRNKVYKPTTKDGIQKPGGLERFIAKFFVFLTGFVAFFAVMGILMRDTEMALAFGVLALIFLAITIVLKRAHNTSYEENPEYFILKIREKEYQVFYEDIIDWKPSYNEIDILDQTKPDQKYIGVNIKIFKPEILLRKIADMAFDGKFYESNPLIPEDNARKVETLNYLVNNQYGYLVEDYLKDIKND